MAYNCGQCKEDTEDRAPSNATTSPEGPHFRTASKSYRQIIGRARRGFAETIMSMMTERSLHKKDGLVEPGAWSLEDITNRENK
jgi:hypothetical protein